jgi:general secretion pathway protein M
MKSWWQSLQARERRLLSIGAVVTAVFLAWLLLWRPLASERERLHSALPDLESRVAEARTHAAGIIAARAAGQAAPAFSGGRSLMTLVDAGAREMGLSNGLKRLQPDGDQRVRVEFEGVSFDVLASWVERQVAEGVEIREWSVDRGLVPGVVNARLSLEKTP